MEIHKPKAAHNWREFLIEIGTITCGILIALSLEQVLEWIQWHERVDQAQEAMRHELTYNNAPQAYARAAISGCLSQRLDKIQAAVEAKQSEAQVASLAAAYHPFSVTWDDGSWKSATTTGVSAHFDKRTYDRWFGVFGPLDYFQRDQNTEHSLVDVLRDGSHGVAPLSGSDADRAIRAVQGLRRANQDNTRRAQYFLLRASMLHAQPSNTNAILDDLRRDYGPCVTAPPPLKDQSTSMFDLY